jgi:hypothetical protein
MKVKKEYAILAAAIATLALYLVLRPDGHHQNRLPQPPTVDSAAIDRLVITKSDNTSLELYADDNQWHIGPQGYRSDAAKAKNMVKTISELTLTAMVSESGSYERYGLTPSEKTRVQAFGKGALLRAFDIGRPAPTQQHTFVLVQGDATVYHARGQIGRTFDHTVESLRDKTVFDFDRTQISAITLRRGDKAMALTKQPINPESETPEAAASAITTWMEWQDASGQKVNQEAVTHLLDGMARMDCDGYLDDQAPERLTDALWSVRFENEHEDFTISVFEKIDADDNKMPAMTSVNPYAFVLKEERVQGYAAALDQLLGSETSQ